MDTWDFRKQCWRNGYRPLAIRTSPQILKFPTDNGWTVLARQNPPPAVALPPDPECQNTGILADGLQPIDVDLRDPAHCYAVAEWCLTNWGEAPIRFRANSGHLLLLYRADDGEPHKCKVWEPGVNGQSGQGVEVLGHGLQFVAYGVHPSGTTIRWVDDQGPHTVKHDDLTPITIEQVNDLLAYAKQFLNLDAIISRARIPSLLPPPTYTGKARWLDKDIKGALDAIPNVTQNYHHWLDIAMAVHAASHGHAFDLFRDWSATNHCHDEKLTRKTWNALSRNPPTRITGGTLIHHARLSNGGFWVQPSHKLAIIDPFH